MDTSTIISQVLFYGIGIAAAYMVYRMIRKSFSEGKCAGCACKDKCIKYKEEIEKNKQE